MFFQINNFQFSSSKSKSHEKLYAESYHEIPNPSYVGLFNKHIKIPLSPPIKSRVIESSMMKKRTEPQEPVLQSKQLFNTLIDSPCTKFEKVQYNNALSSATKFLLNRHLESVSNNSDIFQETTPTEEISSDIEYKLNEHETDLDITSKQNIFLSDCETQTSNIPFIAEDIEELKKNEIENIHQAKLKCCDLIKTQLKIVELEIEKHFSVLENKVTENYDKLLNKIQYRKNESDESIDTFDTTVETVKEKNYTRMTGAFGILNNLNQECSFLKTPNTKGKTREEMLKKGTLTPCTMSFVLQEQLMNLDNSS